MSYMEGGALQPTSSRQSMTPSVLSDGAAVGVRRKKPSSAALIAIESETTAAARSEAAVVRSQDWAYQAMRHEVEQRRINRSLTINERRANMGVPASSPPPLQEGGRNNLASPPSSRQADRLSPWSMYKAPSPKMGSRIDTHQRSSTPGPGSYALPSMFTR